MAITKTTKATFPFTLRVVAQGEDHTINLVCFNRKGSELEAKFADGGTMAELVQFLVKSWDIEYDLTAADLIELEDSWPGVLTAVLEGYTNARMVAKAKN